MKYAKHIDLVTELKITPVNSDSQVNIMEQNQQEQRQTAAQEFQAALDELEDILQEQPIEDKTTQGLHNGSVSDAQLAQEDEGYKGGNLPSGTLREPLRGTQLLQVGVPPRGCRRLAAQRTALRNALAPHYSNAEPGT